MRPTPSTPFWRRYPLFLFGLCLLRADLASAEPQHPGAEVGCRDFRTGSSIAVYAERVTGDGLVHAGWTPDSTRLCMGTGHQYSFALAGDGAGGALVAWVEPRAGGSDIRVQHLAASGLTAGGWPAGGIAACASPRDQYGPRAVTDGQGGAFVAWQDFRNDHGRIYVRRIGADGSFPAGWEDDGINVSTGDSEQSSAVLVPDGAGGAIVVWQDYRDGATRIRAQRLTSAGGIASGWPSDGAVVCVSPHAQRAPVAVSDGAGGAIVVWEENRVASATSLHAARVTPDGHAAAGWSATGVALGVSTDAQVLAAIASDGAGGALVAWCQGQPGEGDIYIQRVTSAGLVASGWPAAGRAICTAPGEQYAPAVLADGAGGAFVAWEDYRASGEGDVYVQRLTGAGALAPGWLENGAVVCDAAGAQFAPLLAGDGAGGAIATWFDARSSAFASFGPARNHPVRQEVAFALEGARPSPARDVLEVSLALPDAAPARLELLDLQGRRLAAREVGDLGAGRHRVTLGPRRLPAGVYWLRLIRLGHALTATAVVLN